MTRDDVDDPAPVEELLDEEEAEAITAGDGGAFSGGFLPEYRPAFGFALWGLATVLDVPYVGGEVEGLLSLAGFVAALAWAVGPRSLLGIEDGGRP